jgi:fatty aldehyde-generating acyl-ACP reductase
MRGLPYLPRQTPTFAFIVHPRNEDDMFRATCLSLLRSVSADDAEYVARVRALPPTIVGEVRFGFDLLRGEIVSIACLPQDVPTARGRQEIARAAQLAVDRGAKVIGLGALTAPATGGGAWLRDLLGDRVTITNGNAYTASILRRNVLDAVTHLALDRRPCVAVIGCTGSVGAVLSRLLANAGVNLVLIGRKKAKVAQVLGDLSSATLSEDINDAVVADVVVVLTSAPSARVTPRSMRPGAVIIDAAEPANISDEDARAWSAHATVVRGARVRIPSYHCSYDFGLADAKETFACLAETYLCARDGIRQHSVGTPDPAFAERLDRTGVRNGVQPALAFPDHVDAAAARAGLIAQRA